MSRVAALAMCCAIAGCGGPDAIWSGWSPDRSARVVITERDGAQRLTIDDAAPREFDAIAIEQVRWSERGLVAPARRGDAWWMLDGTQERGPYLAVGAAVIAGPYVAFPALRADGWRVISGEHEGAPFDAIDGEIQLDAKTGALAYVARRRGQEHVVWGDRIGPPCALVALLELGARGETVAYVDRGARDRVLVDHVPVGAWDEVLELALAGDSAHWAAIVDEGGCAIVRDAETGAARLGPIAPALTHLRISDDGAHVACLAPAVDGSGIEVHLDGSVVARHRRIEGDALAFVPGTSSLVVVSEDSQGPRIAIGDRRSERYEEIDGPLFAPGRVAWIGRRGGRSAVVIDGEIIAEEPWAGALRLATEGTGYAYVARAGSDRVVVTRRGRWPVPRLFVDTVVIDDTGHHWAALVPDVDAHRLEIWIDGTPRTELDEHELGGEMVQRGDARALESIRAIVRGELARSIAREPISGPPSSAAAR